MTRVLLVSVSTPAVKQAVEYARRMRDRDVDFRIHYICGTIGSSMADAGRLRRDVAGADLIVLDLMGADGGFMMAAAPALKSSPAQRIVIGRMGPVSSRLGGFDPEASKADAEDAAVVETFSELYRRCAPGDFGHAMDMVLRRCFGRDDIPEPPPFGKEPDVRIKEPAGSEYWLDADEYAGSSEDWVPGRMKVALLYNGNSYPSDPSEALERVARGIREFANVLPIAFDRYGYDDTKDLRRLMGGKPDLIVAFMGFRFISGPMGGSSRAAMEFIEDMDAPFLRPCFMTRSSREEWEQRTSGFQVMEFMINGFMPELDGGTCIFPVGANEDTESFPEWGVTLSEVRIIEDRLSRLIGKVRGLLRLRSLKNEDKRVAIIGYNYPPGEGSLFGGSFLDTFGSLSNILDALASSGYETAPMRPSEIRDRFVKGGILNDSKWVRRSDEAIRYRGGSRHPDAVRREWGEEPGSILADGDGYVIPGIRNGNVFIGIQPPRGNVSDPKSYHDPYMPPQHQYLAFYEWLRDVFKADAVVHIGTHGTLEFLPGKENAMSGECYPDMVLGDVPHFYLYYSGNPSEAMIAKRRSHAVHVSYMPPPFVRSGLYGDLSDLSALIAEYRESLTADKGRSGNVLETLRAKAESMRLPTDVDELEHELDDIRESLIPDGFHVFGKGFEEKEAEEFAFQSMRFPHGKAVPLEEALGQDAERICREYNRSREVPDGAGPEAAISLETEGRILDDARRCDEIPGLLKALEGGYSKVKLGGDARRCDEILPSGYNIVQFDPNAVPSDAAMARGAEAADGTIEMYRREHGGEYPRSVAVVMWGLETSRTQGATVGQILRYLGFRRGRGGRDFASRFEPVPPEELGRPRIDVTVTICGFFRDMFSNIVTGLNALFARLDSMDEDDEVSNFARNTRENYSRLISEGYSEEDARDLSRCRLFGPGEGLYGTGGITDAVNSSSWKDEKDLADIFVRNMGHAYSMRHRGLDVPGLMTMNHGRVDVVTQTRDMEERELIDLDHYYEFFGGLSKTVSLARGSGAAMYITDSAGPRLRTLDVRRSIEHGVRTRLLNPKWIDGMLRTDYHGAQHINDRFENVLGLAATTGAVDSGVFSDMEAVYIADKKMRDRLRKNNNWALMAMIDRLAEANSRGYWKATREELETLREAYDECEELAEDESDSDCDN